MDLENWDDLKFVLAMTRHGTMSAAARFLDTNVATVSRRIERMSQDIGMSLFEKRGQAFVATPAALQLSELAEGLEQQLRTLMSGLRTDDDNVAVPLEVAAPPAVHSTYLMPRLTELAEHMPQVMMTLTDKVFAQGLGEADIQVRIGRPEGGRLKARKFRDYSLRVFHGADHQLNGDWIGLSHRYPDSDLLCEVYQNAKPLPRYRVEEMPLVYHLVCSTGLPGLLPDFIVQPGDGLVVADLPNNDLPGELWITYHETRHADTTLRAVVDWFCRPSNSEAAA
ncbi:LysR family transcriptional regulator [Jannaschia pagri]|uniref:LysR family transcriptional regulator n=1 Tax=Jannaschia pagri TaxID=2829797 RepID=A0ABQ4NP11_9RHOB|nr:MULTISPECIES: LysR family transcriptional regulator [unclassified Jannaschia]GIT92180.1 LysR family transcriptional regulator [Jannaschia sp. AI_61]GIT96015.1 LysR family transcriptional regulator [Jannaschia sp. AI_62]